MTARRLKDGDTAGDDAATLYLPGSHTIYGFVMEDGKTEYGREPVEDFLAKGYAELPFREAADLARKAGYSSFITSICEITREAFDEALGCLPPEAYYSDERGCCFRMMEYYWADVTSHYASVGGKYYTQRRKVGSQREFLDEVVGFHVRSGFANNEQGEVCRKS